MLVGMIDTRLSFRTIKAQLEAIVDEEETTDETAEIEIEQLADDLEATKERFRDFARQNRILAFALSVQREESDILWWMLAEWSETCQKSYRDMSKEEAALFSAYELSNSISFSIGPETSCQGLFNTVHRIFKKSTKQKPGPHGSRPAHALLTRQPSSGGLPRGAYA